MQDMQKLFEIIKNTRSDKDAAAELSKQLDLPHEYTSFFTAGYKPTTSNTTHVFGGYNSSAGNDADHRDSSLFSYALTQSKPHVAAMLLQRLGVEILSKSNDKNENGFHAVANCSDESFRRWFLQESILSTMTQLSDQFKESINQISKNEEHVFALLFSHKPTLEEVVLWLKIGADPAISVGKQGNLLALSCEKSRPDLTQYLSLHFSSLLQSRNDKGQQPAYIAAGQESPECLKILINAGAPTSTEDKAFNRPLHHAIAKGRVAAARMILQQEQMVLISSGEIVPYVNVPNGSMETPLHLMITHLKNYNEGGFREMLDLLLNYGADLSRANDKGLTPIKLAKEEKIPTAYFEILWSRYTEKMNFQVFTADTLTRMICQHYSPTITQQLLQALAPIFATQAPNPYQALRQDHVDDLKRMALIRYPGQSQNVQAFNVMLDQLTEFSRTRHAVSREDSSMSIQGSPLRNLN